MKNFLNSLFFKIPFPVFFTLIVFTIVLSFSVYRLSRSVITSKIEQYLVERNDKIKIELSDKIKYWFGILKVLSFQDSLGELNWNRSLPYLNRVFDENPDIQSFFIADKSGNVNRTGAKSGNIGEREYFKKALAGEMTVSEPLVGKLSGNPLVTITSPLYYQGKIIGVVGIAVELSQLSGIVNKDRIGESGYSFMIDKRGVILAHPAEKLLFTRGDFIDDENGGSLRELIRTMTEQKSGVMYYRYKEDKKVCVYSPLGINGWSIGTSITVNEIQKDVFYLGNQTLAISILTFIMVSLILFFQLYFLVILPIRRFNDSVTIIQSGDFSHRINNISDDEIGHLKNSFNQMTALIDKTVKNLNRNESHLVQSLHEKEVLLNEVHHRVKNNLNTIISLLKLQGHKISDSRYQDLIADSINRIYSMALIHENLYTTGIYSEINMKDYLNKLVHHLNHIYNAQKSFRLDFNADEIYLPLEKAISLGIILNELMTNCFKHAFSRTENKIIQLSFFKNVDGFIIFDFSDNGDRITTDWSPEKSSGLGMELIKGLVIQIDGEMSWKVDNGLKYKIIIREKKE